METLRPDLCILGAGAGGLSVAAGAAQMGASVVVVEKGRMGGDCLNYGCVPSKALLAAAHAAHAVRTSGRFGVNGHEPKIDFARVHDHVHGAIAAIAHHDSQERFEKLGCTVIRAGGRFVAPDTMEADGQRIRARRFVIATGSSAGVPPIPGIDGVPYLTNESIFEQTERPDHLIVIGGGPIGLEMAQAHRRLGAKVTVLELLQIMGKDDPELVQVVRSRLGAEGIRIFEGIKIKRVEKHGNGIAVLIEENGIESLIDGSHLLVAAGRKPNVAGLDLEKAGIVYSPKGIEVDARLRTTNKKVFAIGDVAGSFQFTHMAGYHAGIVIRNALFRLPAKVDSKAVPWVTFTDPELSHVGQTEAQARQAGIDVTVLRSHFHDNNRAQTEGETEGLIKVVATRKGVVLGATIVGAHAGELILPWVLAVKKGLGVGDMAGIIAPYPTLSEISKAVAGSFYTPKLFTERTRKIVRFIQRFA